MSSIIKSEKTWRIIWPHVMLIVYSVYQWSLKIHNISFWFHSFYKYLTPTTHKVHSSFPRHSSIVTSSLNSFHPTSVDLISFLVRSVILVVPRFKNPSLFGLYKFFDTLQRYWFRSTSFLPQCRPLCPLPVLDLLRLWWSCTFLKPNIRFVLSHDVFGLRFYTFYISKHLLTSLGQ